MKKFNTKKIVATGLGAALFTLLFMYVKIPTGIPNTNIQTAYGVGAFFAALFGPLAGGLIAFIGHALNDATQGGIWWSWVIASGVDVFIIGLVSSQLKVEEGEFSKKDIILFNIFQIVANVIAWGIVAPSLDVLIYKESFKLVITQGIVAAISNAVSCGLIGTVLLSLYAKTRSKKGSLSKGN